MRTLAALLLALAAALPLGAVERSAAPGERLRQGEASKVNPPFVFSLRGRRDPFMPAALFKAGGSAEFSISFLAFKGVLEMGGGRVGLFTSTRDNATYTLRGGRLFGPGGEAVPGIAGRMVSGQEARLRQGERTLTFKSHRSIKR